MDVRDGKTTLTSAQDLRDLRDPQAIGEWLLNRPTKDRASEGYDTHIRSGIFRLVSNDDSMGKQCVREYRAELEARAAEGDKYAQSALESLNRGKGVQGYDDAGS